MIRFTPMLLLCLSVSCLFACLENNAREERNDSRNATKKGTGNTNAGNSKSDNAHDNEGCTPTGEMKNVCIKTTGKKFESRAPNYLRKSCWLKDDEVVVEDSYCVRETCSVPPSGMPADEGVMAACESFNNKEACMKYSSDLFPYRCTWDHAQGDLLIP